MNLKTKQKKRTINEKRNIVIDYNITNEKDFENFYNIYSEFFNIYVINDN